MKMKALILAGGFGTRLKDVVKDIPKPMATIFDKPFLEHQIHFLKKQNVNEIILAVHYMANKIKSYFGNGGKFEVNLTYSEEDFPLGTAGAVKNAEKYIDDAFFVLNGDSYSNLDLWKFLEFHKAKRSNFSMSLIKSKSPLHYGNVIIDESKIIEFSEKKSSMEEGLVNSGIYIFEPEIFNCIESGKNVSLETEIFPRLAREGKLYGYPYEGYFMDIGKPETYNQFRKDMLDTIILEKGNIVRKAFEKIEENKIDLVLITDKEKRLLGVLNDKIIRRHLLKNGNLEDAVEDAMAKEIITAKTSDDESRISELLLTAVNRLPIIDQEGKVIDVRFRVEEIKEEIYPEVAGKSPLRISFAGGGTDVTHFFEKYGGVVISCTIDKYCRARAVKRADSKIIINSDLGNELVANSRKDLRYNGNFDLIKAVINIVKPDFGLELYLHNDIPPGRGLGSSASLSVLVIKLLNYLQGIEQDDYKIAELAYRTEREELKIKGGWQDQYAAVTGGFNFMEFSADKNIIYPLRLKEEVINELNSRLMLCYVGKSRCSGDIHTSQEKTFIKDEREIALKLNELKKIAIDIKNCLLTNDIEKIGELLHYSWENKRSLDTSISNPAIDTLYETGLKNGASGGKLLGAGGGGYILFFCQPQKRNQLANAFRQIGGEILNFNFDARGTEIWPVKGKY